MLLSVRGEGQEWAGFFWCVYLSLTLPLPAKASFYKLCFDVMLCFCVLLQASCSCFIMFLRFYFAKNTQWRLMKLLCWSFVMLNPAGICLQVLGCRDDQSWKSTQRCHACLFSEGTPYTVTPMSGSQLEQKQKRFRWSESSWKVYLVNTVLTGGTALAAYFAHFLGIADYILSHHLWETIALGLLAIQVVKFQ